MKKIITLAALLATAHVYCQNFENIATRLMKKIVITTETTQADGQVLKNEQTIHAIVVTPEQATELKANNETHLVDALKNSMPYHKVFMIEDTAYFIMAEDASTVKRSVMVTDDVADENIMTTQDIIPATEQEQTPVND